jgi:mono/diheme cytochrome c family protein
LKTKLRHFLQPMSLGGKLYSTTVVVGLAMLLMMPEQAEPQAPNSAQPPRGDAEKGRTLYIKYGCYECHGTEAQGGGYTGPRLAPPAEPLEVLLSQVRDPVNEMPPFTKKVLSDHELLDIYAFLQSIPNPPAVNTIPILGASK